MPYCVSSTCNTRVTRQKIITIIIILCNATRVVTLTVFKSRLVHVDRKCYCWKTVFERYSPIMYVGRGWELNRKLNKFNCIQSNCIIIKQKTTNNRYRTRIIKLVFYWPCLFWNVGISLWICGMPLSVWEWMNKSRKRRLPGICNLREFLEILKNSRKQITF